MSKIISAFTSCFRAPTTKPKSFPKSLTFVFVEPTVDRPEGHYTIERRVTKKKKLQIWAKGKKESLIQRVTGRGNLPPPTAGHTSSRPTTNMTLPEPIAHKPMNEKVSKPICVPARPPTITMPHTSMPILTPEFLESALYGLRTIRTIPPPPPGPCPPNRILPKEIEQMLRDEHRINKRNNLAKQFGPVKAKTMLKINLAVIKEISRSESLVSVDTIPIDIETPVPTEVVPEQQELPAIGSIEEQRVDNNSILESFGSFTFRSLAVSENEGTDGDLEWCNDEYTPSMGKPLLESKQMDREERMLQIETMRKNRGMFGLEDLAKFAENEKR